LMSGRPASAGAVDVVRPNLPERPATARVERGRKAISRVSFPTRQVYSASVGSNLRFSRARTSSRAKITSLTDTFIPGAAGFVSDFADDEGRLLTAHDVATKMAEKYSKDKDIVTCTNPYQERVTTAEAKSTEAKSLSSDDVVSSSAAASSTVGSSTAARQVNNKVLRAVARPSLAYTSPYPPRPVRVNTRGEIILTSKLQNEENQAFDSHLAAFTRSKNSSSVLASFPPRNTPDNVYKSIHPRDLQRDTEVYRKQITDLTSTVDHMQKELQKLTEKSTSDSACLKSTRQQLHDKISRQAAMQLRIQELEQALRGRTGQIATLTNELDNVETRWEARLEEAVSTNHKLTSDNTRMSQELESLSQNAKTIEKLHAANQRASVRLNDFKSENARLKETTSTLREQLDKALLEHEGCGQREAEFANLLKAHQALKQELRVLQMQHENVSRSLLDMTEMKNSIQASAKKREAELASLEADHEPCAARDRALAEATERIRTMEHTSGLNGTSIEQLTKKLAKLASAHAPCQSSISLLTKDLADAKGIIQDLQGYRFNGCLSQESRSSNAI